MNQPDFYVLFKAMVRAGKTGKWLDQHCGRDWRGVSSEGFSLDGRLRAEVHVKSTEEAEALAAICREDGYVVFIVPRTYRDLHGKDLQEWSVAFSRGDLHTPWPR